MDDIENRRRRYLDLCYSLGERMLTLTNVVKAQLVSSDVRTLNSKFGVSKINLLAEAFLVHNHCHLPRACKLDLKQFVCNRK